MKTSLLPKLIAASLDWRIPGKGWNPMLRFYAPLESWFDKAWRPGEIELVK